MVMGGSLGKRGLFSSLRVVIGRVGMFPWGKGGLEKQPSFCHHNLLQLLLISCLMGEIAGGRLQNHLGKVKPPWVLPTPSSAGHGWGSGLGPTFDLDWVAMGCGSIKRVQACGGKKSSKEEKKGHKEGDRKR